LDLISQSMLGIAANRSSGDPKMSDDGRFIAFKSASTNLVRLQPLDDLSLHLYMVDRKQQVLMQIDDHTDVYDPAKNILGRFEMDRSGRIVVFEGHKRAWDQPEEVLTTSDLFVFDRSTGTIKALTSGIFAHRSGSPSLTADGRFLAFVLRGSKKDRDEG